MDILILLDSPDFVRLVCIISESIEMEKIRPLSKFPIVDTNQIDEAEFCISNSITDVQINRVDDRNNFRLIMNAVNIGCISMLYNSFETQTTLTTRPSMDAAIFVTTMGNPITIHVGHEKHTVTQKEAAIIRTARKICIERPAHSEILYFRVSMPDLLGRFETLTDRHHRGSLSFIPKISLAGGSGAILKGLMEYLVSVFAFNESTMKSPVLRNSFDNLLLDAMLALPHSKLDLLNEDRSSMVAPSVVYRAEEYMREHLSEHLTISDLIRVCACSRSVLFSTFRNTRNYTPMEFLIEQRLQLVNKLLLKSDDQASISSIALNCGFSSYSWFSQVYNRRFNERPSDTLRNKSK